MGGVLLDDGGEEDPQEGDAGDVVVQLGLKLPPVAAPVVLLRHQLAQQVKLPVWAGPRAQTNKSNEKTNKQMIRSTIVNFL